MYRRLARASAPAPIALLVVMTGAACRRAPPPVESGGRASASSSGAGGAAAGALAEGDGGSAESGTGATALTARADGKLDAPGAAALTHAIARRRADGAVEIRFHDAALPCDDATAPQPYASITLFPGPAGTYFAGAPIGLEAFVETGDRARVFPGRDVDATLERFEARTGARVRGSVATHARVGGLSGSFDATVCADDVGSGNADAGALDAALPGPGLEAPVTAVYDGTEVAMRTATVSVVDDLEEHENYVKGAHFAFVRPPTLGGAKVAADASLTIEVVCGGASGARQLRAKMLETPQPIVATLAGGGVWASSHEKKNLPPAAWSGTGHGWIRFTAIELKTGSVVEGEIAATFPRGKVSGHFRGSVIPY